MKTFTDFQWHGKKAKTGGLIWDEHDRMYIFVTYCMNCHGKVALTLEEAREFARHYSSENNKIRTRLGKALLGK